MSGKQHAIRAGQPSAMARTFACPGWVARSEGIEEFHSEWAIQGTAAHAFAAHLLEMGHNASDYADYHIHADILHEYWPQWLKKHAHRQEDNPYKIDIDEEFIEAVQFYVDQCRALTQPLDLTWIETKLDCRAYHPEVWGTGDWGRFRPSTGELVVLDYKHGIKYGISPENNPQLLCYALGLCFIPEVYRKVRTIWTGICQPRALGEPIKWAQVDPAYLYKWGYEMANKVDYAINWGAGQLEAGPHCQYCPAFGVCEVAAANALQFYGEHTANQPNSLSDPQTYDLNKLARAYSLIPYVKQWIKEVEQFANREADKGCIIPGYKLIQRYGHRKYKDETKVRVACHDLGYEDDRIWTFKLKSPAQMEKLIGKKQFEEHLTPLVDKPAIGNKLVKEEDTRPTMRPSIEVEFQPRKIGAD